MAGQHALVSTFLMCLFRRTIQRIYLASTTGNFQAEEDIYTYVLLRFDDISKKVVYQKPEERQYDQSMLYVQHILNKNGKLTGINL